MSASSSPPPIPSSYLHRELDRLDPLEVRLVERRARARLHPRGDAGDPRDRVDRMAEEVAVVDARAAAEPPHLVAQPRLDERVDHHRRPAACAGDRQREILDRLDPRVPHLLERQVGELRLEREHEPRRGLARRVGDDVELDGDLAAHRREATAAVRPPVSGEQVGRCELELQPAAPGADVDRLECERRLVEDRRQRAALAERADSARDVARRALCRASGLPCAPACRARGGRAAPRLGRRPR